MARESRRRLPVPIRLKACIYYRGTRLSTCWSSAIGPSGIALATGNLAYFPGTPFEIEFMLPDKGGMRTVRFAALVRRNRPGLTELDFTAPGTGSPCRASRQGAGPIDSG